jgi:Zn finger protein HypA/HybF involved in hydrogenase expression
MDITKGAEVCCSQCDYVWEEDEDKLVELMTDEEAVCPKCGSKKFEIKIIAGDTTDV